MSRWIGYWANGKREGEGEGAPEASLVVMWAIYRKRQKLPESADSECSFGKDAKGRHALVFRGAVVAYLEDNYT